MKEISYQEWRDTYRPSKEQIIGMPANIDRALVWSVEDEQVEDTGKGEAEETWIVSQGYKSNSDYYYIAEVPAPMGDDEQICVLLTIWDAENVPIWEADGE